MHIYLELGGQNNETMYKFFLLFPGFLELINNMLTSGMVPALFADDEKEAIIGGVSCTLESWTTLKWAAFNMI